MICDNSLCDISEKYSQWQKTTDLVDQKLVFSYLTSFPHEKQKEFYHKYTKINKTYWWDQAIKTENITFIDYMLSCDQFSSRDQLLPYNHFPTNIYELVVLADSPSVFHHLITKEPTKQFFFDHYRKPFFYFVKELAIKNNKLNILKYFVEQRMKIKQRDIFIAIIFGSDCQIIEYLLTADCPWSNISYHYAASYGRLDVIQLFRKFNKPCDEQVSYYAIKNQRINILQYILDEKLNICREALLIAIKAKNQTMVNLLLKYYYFPDTTFYLDLCDQEQLQEIKEIIMSANK